MTTHRNLHWILIVFIIAILTDVGVAVNNTGTVLYNPESVLMGFRFDVGKLKTEQEIIRRFGVGCVGQNKRGYIIPNSKCLLEFDIQGKGRWVVGIGIKYSDNATRQCRIKGDIGEVITGRGLKLGDDVENALKLYGQPEHVNIGKKILYAIDLNAYSAKEYWLYYSDHVVYKSGADSANGVPPHSQMGIKICKTKVCEIGLVVFNWSDNGEIIPRVKKQSERTEANK